MVLHTEQTSRETREHVEAALEAGPDNPYLLGLLANILVSDLLMAFNDADKDDGARAKDVKRAEEAANRAISLAPKTALAHFALGCVHRIRGHHQAAFDAFEAATKFDPKLAKAYAQAGNQKVFLGKPDEAILLAKKAIELSPQHSAAGTYSWVLGRAYFTQKKYPKAIEALEESVGKLSSHWFGQAWLVAAYALAGRVEDATRARVAFEKAFPRFGLDRITQIYQEDQYNNETLKKASKALLQGLEKAGLKKK
jgi:tetratricopeptide (TPR) repeat protein